MAHFMILKLEMKFVLHFGIFTRSINDDIVSSMMAKETLRKSQSSKTRDKTSISNEKCIVNNSSSTTKIAYKQLIDNGRLYKTATFHVRINLMVAFHKKKYVEIIVFMMYAFHIFEKRYV